MGQVVRRASDVRINEVDLSSSLTGSGSCTAAIVPTSSMGPIEATFYSSFDAFRFDFGAPNAAVSFGGYSAQDFFADGNSLWARRPIGTGYKYSAGLVKNNSVGVTSAAGVTNGIANPKAIDWTGIVSAGDTGIYVVTPRRGPGSYGNNIGFRIESKNISSVGTVAATTTSIGGTLTAATYEYVLSAISADGSETLASAPTTVVVGSATTTNTVTVAWDLVSGAIGYNIYGRTSGTPYFITQVGGATNSFTDLGTITPDSARSPITNPSNLAAASPLFTIHVYDNDVSLSTPVESFACSVTEQVDETGAQMEPTQRINPFSQYIRIESNVPNLVTTPMLFSTAKVNLTGGTSGSAPTATNINACWEDFKNKELYVIDSLINAGDVDIIVQKKMDEVAQKRSDCVAFLDSPASSQTAQGVVDYKNLTLNLSSSYSVLLAQDLLESDSNTGKLIFVPPSGAVAGLMARAFAQGRPWFSLAGLNYGMYNGNVLDIRHRYDDGEATLVSQHFISYSRFRRGQGISLWEQNTTISKNSALQDISVRILCNIIKRACYNYLVYQLQEQNDDILARQIKIALDQYLATVINGRGLRSADVVISGVNNPPAMKNAGILAIAIILVPIRPVREIQLTLGLSKAGVTIDESVIASL